METTLQQIAKQRWLKTSELLDLLQNPNQLLQMVPLLQKHTSKPESGLIVLFNKNNKDWRQDNI